jgi:hypothetical protein
VVTVRLVDVPVQVFLRAHDHYDDVLREVALMALDRPRGRGAVPLSAHLLRRMEGIRSLRNERVDRVHQTVLAAAARGDATVDVELEIPLPGVALVEELAHLQDQLDAHCRAGDLMTLEAPPDVKAFRRHLAGEVVRQARDRRPPRPFPPG